MLSLIDSTSNADFKSTVRLFDELSLDSDVLHDESQTLLKHADFHIGGSDFGDEEHQRVVVVFDGGVQVGFGRLDRAAETTPEIEFPGDVEPNGVVVEKPIRQRIGDSTARSDVGDVEEHILRLRKQTANGDVSLRASRENPRAGASQT